MLAEFGTQFRFQLIKLCQAKNRRCNCGDSPRIAVRAPSIGACQFECAARRRRAFRFVRPRRRHRRDHCLDGADREALADLPKDGSKAIQTTPPQDLDRPPSFRSSIESNPTRPFAQPRGGGVQCSRAVVVVFAVEQRSTTVSAQACRQRRRLAARHDLTIVRQIDDVAGRRYVFFNHGCSSRLTRCLSQTSFAQTFSPPLKFYRRNWGTAHTSRQRLNPALFCDTIDRVFANRVRSR